MPQTLIYTCAIDLGRDVLFHNLALLLAVSIRSTGFQGDIVVFSNKPALLHEAIAQNLLICEALDICDSSPHAIWAQKYLVADRVLRYAWDQAIFMDADSLVLGSLDAVTNTESLLLYCIEPGTRLGDVQFNGYLSEDEMLSANAGINSGFLLLHRSVFSDVMRMWAAVDSTPMLRDCFCSDQASLNRVILDIPFAAPVVEHTIIFPLHKPYALRAIRNATIAHFMGSPHPEKLRWSLALFGAQHVFDAVHWKYNLLPIHNGNT